MLTLWLPSLNGDIRLLDNAQWISFPSFEALSDRLLELKMVPSASFGAKQAKNKNIAAKVYFPTLLLTQVTQPIERTQYQKLGATGIAYLLENHILGSVDNLSVKSRLIKDQIYIGGMELSSIGQIQNSLSLIGLKAEALLPDFLLLPTPTRGDSVFAYHDDTTTLIRTNENQGFAVDDIPLTLAKLESISQLNGLGDVQKLQNDLVDHPVLVNAADTNTLDTSLDSRHWLNMLPKQAGTQISPYWRVIAAVAALALVSVLLFDALRIVRYKSLEKSYKAQTYKQYSHWFADKKPPRDLKRAVESMTQQGTDNKGSLFELLSSVSPLIKQSGLDAKRMQFNRDALNINLSAKNINELQTLVKKLQAQGINATLGNVVTVEASVEGEVSITI